MSFVLRLDAVIPGGKVSQAERAMHVDLTTAHRLVVLNGWDDLVHTHLFVTVPGETDHFPISAFGLAFDKITVFNFAKINDRGQLVGDWPEDVARPSTDVTDFALHVTVHVTRPDAQCVIRLHNTAGIAMPTQRHGLLPLSQHAVRFHRRITYRSYEGLASTPGEDTHFAAPLGSHLVMLLRSHGTLTIGRIVAGAHVLMAILIKACETQIQIQIQAQAGGEAAPLAPHVANRAVEQLEDGGAIEGVIGWPALLRELDRIDASYYD